MPRGQSSRGTCEPGSRLGIRNHMATMKVGIYRSYYGPVPLDPSGQPLPRIEWPKKRSHSWVVRWFGTDQNRYSKSFDNRKEAERFAEAKQSEVREGKSDPPEDISMGDFAKEHARLMQWTSGRRDPRRPDARA